MGDIKRINEKTAIDIGVLTDLTDEMLKPLEISRVTALDSIRHMYIWFLVFDELNERLGYGLPQMMDLTKRLNKKDENDG